MTKPDVNFPGYAATDESLGFWKLDAHDYANYLILTNRYGDLVVDDFPEPEPGSIILAGGPHGTAWQRFFTDNRWHSARGNIISWRSLIVKRNLVLVYSAIDREKFEEDRAEMNG